jgi:hypothetical protein
MKLFLTATALLFISSAAQAFPPQCTSQFGYSAKCCAASYGRKAEGTMDNGQRHAELAACTAKAKK